MRRSDVVLAAPTVGDGAAMWQVARTVGLDENSPYKYLLFCRDFAATPCGSFRHSPTGTALD